MIASPTEPLAEESAPDAQALAPAPSNPPSPSNTAPASTAPASTDAIEAAAPPTQRPARESTPLAPTLEAGVKPLERVNELVGPVSLVPGPDVSVQLLLQPDGTVAVAIPEHTPVVGGTDGSPGYLGYPLANVAEGVLFAPLAGNLGAVAYWRPGVGVSFPLPDATTTTSYMAASGDLGIFLSIGEVVVRDLARFADILRVEARIDGSPVVHACANLENTALALGPGAANRSSWI